jgi:hypothetical protein
MVSAILAGGARSEMYVIDAPKAPAVLVANKMRAR